VKKLTKKEQAIIDNLDPKCEDCEHYRDHRGRMMCHAMAPFLAYKETARLRPHGSTMNCGTEGQHFKPNASLHAPAPESALGGPVARRRLRGASVAAKAAAIKMQSKQPHLRRPEAASPAATAPGGVE